MTKTELLNRFAKDEEERLALSRVLDKGEITASRDVPSNSQFLTPAQRDAAMQMLETWAGCTYRFFGGYEEAERTVCMFLPSWHYGDCDDGALAVIEAFFPKDASPTHRDLLGSLMGLGLTRDKIGDILVHQSYAQIIVLEDIADTLIEQWDSAGRHALRICRGSFSDLIPPLQNVRIIRDTIANLRLDSAVACGFSISRSRASALISEGKVTLNHRECNKGDRAIAAGDRISCRGFGKVLIKSLEGQSHKGRNFIELERYE